MEREQKSFYEKLEQRGVSRRGFMKFCTFLTATMGLSSSFVPRVAEVFAAPRQRPPVIWLHFGECTGCSEAMLRSQYPYPDDLVLEILSVEYHETIMAAAGQQADDNLRAAVDKYSGRFICVVEGAIATRYNGGYGKTAGRTFLETAREVLPKAAGVICIGACASFGGIQAARPNPGGYKGVGDALGIKTVNIPGCPPNPVNFIGTIVNYLLLGSLPALDDLGRPLFAYGKTVHDQCPRRGTTKWGNSLSPSVRKKRPWDGVSTRWAAGARKPTTTAQRPSSTTAPAGLWRPGIPASDAASRTSGTISRRFSKSSNSTLGGINPFFSGEEIIWDRELR